MEGEVRPVWFEVEERYGRYLCAERSDAFLIGLLNHAQRDGYDIVCEAPVGAQLLYQIRTYLVPSLARNSAALYATRIEAEMDATRMRNAGGVGTGISCGVDSLSAVKHHARSPYPGLRLTHLVLNNVGAFLDNREQYDWQTRHAMAFAKEYGFELIVSDSNIVRAFPQDHLLTHTYSSCFAIYAMQRLWDVYFYASSGHDYQETFDLRDSEKKAADHYELLSLDVFSTRSLKIYSEGAAINRFEKTRELADWPPAQKYLHVCTSQSGGNCGVCPKCLRTLVTLDALGVLQRFDNVFDVLAYEARRTRHLEWLYRQQIVPEGDTMTAPAYRLLRHRLPFRSRVRVRLMLWAQPLYGRLAKVRWIYALAHPLIAAWRGRRDAK